MWVWLWVWVWVWLCIYYFVFVAVADLDVFVAAVVDLWLTGCQSVIICWSHQILHLLSSVRPCCRAVLHQHPEVQCETPTCKRRCGEEEEEKEMKRKRGGASGCEGNKEPVEVLQKNMRTLEREPRWWEQAYSKFRLVFEQQRKMTVTS